MRRLIKLTGWIVWIVLSGNVVTAQPHAPDILKFADELYRQGDHFRAISEYKRYLYFFPADSLQLATQFRIGQAYQAQGKWQFALQSYAPLLQADSARYWQRKAYLSSIVVAYRQGDYSRSGELADQLFAYCAPADTCWQEGHLLKGLVAARQYDWEQARQEFMPVSPVLTSLAADGLRLPRRSPVVAGLLSALLPGMGQTYAGRWQDGGFSFLLISAAAWATYQAHEDDHTVRLAVFGLGGGVFYLGNIYGAIAAALQFNHRVQVHHFRHIELEVNARSQVKGIVE